MKILVVLFLAMLPLTVTENYEGEWVYESSSTLFSLTLYQEGTIVKGAHSSIMLNGSRIDEAMDDEMTLQGSIENGELIASIRSAYSGATGKARLSVVGQDSIYFEFVERPEECWIPDKVVLTKLK